MTSSIPSFSSCPTTRSTATRRLCARTTALTGALTGSPRSVMGTKLTGHPFGQSHPNACAETSRGAAPPGRSGRVGHPALFPPRGRLPPLALAYHGVADVALRDDPHGLFVRPRDLERQVAT